MGVQLRDTWYFDRRGVTRTNLAAEDVDLACFISSAVMLPVVIAVYLFLRERAWVELSHAFFLINKSFSF